MAALALVLGANLGSAINPLIEGGGATNPAARALPLGNLINRVVGCALVLPFLHPIADGARDARPQPGAAWRPISTRSSTSRWRRFSSCRCAASRRLLHVAAARAQPRPPIPATPLYLDAAALGTPSLALTCAARETLHMGDIVETHAAPDA